MTREWKQKPKPKPDPSPVFYFGAESVMAM